MIYYIAPSDGSAATSLDPKEAYDKQKAKAPFGKGGCQRKLTGGSKNTNIPTPQAVQFRPACAFHSYQ